MQNVSKNGDGTKGSGSSFFAGFFGALIGIIIFVIVQNSSDTHSSSASVASTTVQFPFGGNFFGMSLLMISIFILAIMLTRALALWYWKIDRVVSLLEKIEQNTRQVGTIVPGLVATEVSEREQPRKEGGLMALLNKKIF